MHKPTGFVSALSLAIAGTFIGTSSSIATPIIYTEQDTATGSLGGTAFTDASITLTLTSDTTSVTGPAPLFINVGTMTVSVGGVGSGTFTDTMEVTDQQTPPTAVDFADKTLNEAILASFSPLFAAYDLNTAIGPITGTCGSGAVTQCINPGQAFGTTDGNFILTSAGGATVTATTSVVTAVPEPASLALFGSALGAIGLVRRRKRKAA